MLCCAVLCWLQLDYKASEDHIVTAASCTTNCLAPVVKVGADQLTRRCAAYKVHCALSLAPIGCRISQENQRNAVGVQQDAPGTTAVPSC
jgi:hypothetical protein